jgi:hypothetical protein
MTKIHIIHPAHIQDYMAVHGHGRKCRIATAKDVNAAAAAAVRGMHPYDTANGCVVIVIDGHVTVA